MLFSINMQNNIDAILFVGCGDFTQLVVETLNVWWHYFIEIRGD